MKKKLKKFIVSTLKFSTKFILDKTPSPIKTKIYPLISDPLRNKINSIMGKKDEENFEAYDLLINKKYGKVEENFQIKYLKDDLNNRIFEYLNSLTPLKGESLVKRMSETIDNRSSLKLTYYKTKKQQIDIAKKMCQEVVSEAFELDPNNPIISELHSYLRMKFKDYFKSPIAFVNSRAWWDFPSPAEYGPNKTHNDGFEPGHLKVMVYPLGLSDEGGSLLIEDKLLNNEKSGCCVAFKNSDALHAHVPGKKKRLSIEITLQRSFTDIPQYNKSHFIGRHLYHPRDIYLYSESKSPILPRRLTRLINVGSGYRDWDNWLLLDELQYKNIYRFKINKNSLFPVHENSADLIYTSHHIEHLNDDCLNSFIINSKKALHKEGLLLLKFPDYDYFLDQYKLKNIDFMNNKGVESILWTWPNKNLEDNVENRLAAMFCTYWNEDYGDHFSGQINKNKKAYHGPPIMNIDKLKHLFLNESPNLICKYLVSEAKKDNQLKSFNHRNAWSKEEMKDLMKLNGFEFLSSEIDYIYYLCGEQIPDYFNMADWSSYMLFRIN